MARNYIAGKIFTSGTTTQLSEATIFLGLLDANENILAYTNALKYGVDYTIVGKDDYNTDGSGGATISINKIDANRTYPAKSAPGTGQSGTQCTQFAIFTANNTDPHGSLLNPNGESLTYPKDDGQNNDFLKDVLIQGLLQNAPFISQDTAFQFNDSTISFSVAGIE